MRGGACVLLRTLQRRLRVGTAGRALIDILKRWHRRHPRMNQAARSFKGKGLDPRIRRVDAVNAMVQVGKVSEMESEVSGFPSSSEILLLISTSCFQHWGSRVSAIV